MKPLLLSSIVSVGLFTVATSTRAATCESLASLSLPNISITTAQTIPAGNYTAANGQTYSNLPTFCRVAATATPTSQSDINFEVWVPPADTPTPPSPRKTPFQGSNRSGRLPQCNSRREWFAPS